MTHSDPVSPDAVELPREYGPWRVFHQNVEEGWALAQDQKGRVGVRWNGYTGAYSRLGYPNVRGQPCWFVLPEPIGELVLKERKMNITFKYTVHVRYKQGKIVADCSPAGLATATYANGKKMRKAVEDHFQKLSRENMDVFAIAVEYKHWAPSPP